MENDNKQQAVLVSSAQLSEWIGLTQRRIQQMVADGLLPAPTDGKYDLQRCVMARVKYLETLAAGKATDELDDQKKRMQIELQRQQHEKYRLDAERALLDLEKKKSNLAEVSQVRDEFVRLVRVLTEGADGLPDVIEHTTGAPADVISKIADQVDRWRIDMYRMAAEAFVVEADRPTEDHQVQDKPAGEKRRGRPPKDRKDPFTPQLL